MADVKQDYINRIGDHVLVHGLADASLRPMARAAGTSDRMLIYHFGNKDGLIAALLEDLARRLTVMLDGALPAAPYANRATLLRDVLDVLRADTMRDYIRLWHEVVAAAGRGEVAHGKTARAIADGFVAWLEVRVPQAERDRRAAAAAMLTMIEGCHVMEAIGDQAGVDALLAQLAD